MLTTITNREGAWVFRAGIAVLALFLLVSAACNSTNRLGSDAADDLVAGKDASLNDPLSACPDASAGPGGARTEAQTVGYLVLRAQGPGGTRRPARCPGPAVPGLDAASRHDHDKNRLHAAPLGPAYKAVGFGGSAEGRDELPTAKPS